MAPAFAIAGTISGVVILVTKISPCSILDSSLGLLINLTIPVNPPADAVSPLRIIFPEPITSFLVFFFSVVTARD
jgi:hypothetical protein